MFGRLLDRLGQWVKCDPNFAGMWDCPLAGDEDVRAALSQLDGTERTALTLTTGLSADEINELGGLDR